MMFAIENTTTDYTKKFNTLEDACKNAWAMRDSYGYPTMLVFVNNCYNLEYAENFRTYEDFVKACKTILER